jgi:hypothetical protein
MPKERTHKSFAEVVADFDKLFDVTNDVSLPDVACVILVTSCLNDALGALLDSRWGGDSTKNSLLAPENGTLSSLRAKADVAYCMNLITKGCASNVVKVGEIRNKFAHKFPEVDFQTPKIKDLCASLNPPKQTIQWIPDTPQMREASQRIYNISDPRRRFVLITQGLCTTVLLSANDPPEIKPITDQWDA